MLWVTFFTGSKIWVSHSLPGDDRTWVPRYQLPTPADQSSVGADDLSALVAFDGDKIGVLWSNQLSTSQTMYWSWHQDGTSDQEWNLQVAYQQPEGPTTTSTSSRSSATPPAASSPSPRRPWTPTATRCSTCSP